MTAWDVYLWEVRLVLPVEGGRDNQDCGTHPLERLPAVVQAAVRRAHEGRGGVQITRRSHPRA